MILSKVRTSDIASVDLDADLFLCACGYEQRAIYVGAVLDNRPKRRVAIGFKNRQVLSYSSNIEWFREAGFELFELEDHDFRNQVVTLLAELGGTESNSLKIIVDVSCFNRVRMAHLVKSIADSSLAQQLEVNFIYNVAAFSPPTSQNAPTSVAEPVIPEFSGWTIHPERPPAAVIGLGYEESKAIGIVDHLEINNATWAFVPSGPISEYADAVDAANKSLYSLIGFDGRTVSYDIRDPGSLFRELNTLVELLKAKYNPILIPFGPKLFALSSMLVASIQDDVGVWRVSSGVLEEPSDRKSSEFVTVLNALYEPGH